MDIFPILFDIQLVLLVITLVAIAKEDVLLRWRRRVVRMIRRRRAARRGCEQLHTAPVRPRMSAKEVIGVCRSLTP